MAVWNATCLALSFLPFSPTNLRRSPDWIDLSCISVPLCCRKLSISGTQGRLWPVLDMLRGGLSGPGAAPRRPSRSDYNSDIRRSLQYPIGEPRQTNASDAAHAKVFHFKVVLEPVAGSLPPDAGLLNPAEGCRFRRHAAGVDAHHAIFQGLGHTPDALQVGRIEVGRRGRRSYRWRHARPDPHAPCRTCSCPNSIGRCMTLRLGWMSLSRKTPYG